MRIGAISASRPGAVSIAIRTRHTPSPASSTRPRSNQEDFPMTSVSSSTDRTEPAADESWTDAAAAGEVGMDAAAAGEIWTARALFARHRTVGISVLVLLAVLVAITVGAILASKPLVVSDSTTCAGWGSATYNQQRAYARGYLQAHGTLSSGATSPARVVTAINDGCAQAYANDVQDTATVVAAIRSAG
jgi:hypothetical protein